MKDLLLHDAIVAYNLAAYFLTSHGHDFSSASTRVGLLDEPIRESSRHDLRKKQFSAHLPCCSFTLVFHGQADLNLVVETHPKECIECPGRKNTSQVERGDKWQHYPKQMLSTPRRTTQSNGCSKHWQDIVDPADEQIRMSEPLRETLES